MIDKSTATLDNIAEMETTAKTTLSTLLIQLTNIAYARGLTEGIQLFLMTPSDVIYIPEDDKLVLNDLSPY